jgi:hypothetical protein
VLLFLLALVIGSSADYFTEGLLPWGCGGGLRVRQSWNTLSEDDRMLYAKVVYKMKMLKGKWKNAYGQPDTPLYDHFVDIHHTSTNSACWHGTSWFLPAHKLFLWMFESAYIYTAYFYRDELGITQDKACSLSLPYWDWTLDYDDNSNDDYCPVTDSPIFDSAALGSTKVSDVDKTVVDGVFASDNTEGGGWVLCTPTSSDDMRPTSSKSPNYNRKLKRRLRCDKSYNLNVGPNTVMNAITGNPNYKNFTGWMEPTPHGMPHMFVGYSMIFAASPDDPIFWLHHCNIDRLYALWIDCNGYENVPASQLDKNQYEAVNPVIQSTDKISTNPLTGTPYDVGLDQQIPFSWNKQGVDSDIFVCGAWPTPRQLWAYGNSQEKGYLGMIYRYGEDQLVRAFSKSCPDQTFTLVDAGYVPTKKRDERLHPRMHNLVDTYEAKLSEGKSHRTVLFEMAMSECQSAPKIDFDEAWMSWIEMSNHPIEAFDSLCDSPSQRYKDNMKNRDSQGVSLFTGAVPLWVILVASLCSGLVLIAIITVIIISVRRRKTVVVEDDYIEMNS